MDNSSFPIKTLKDLASAALVLLAFSHHQVHKGNAYRAHFINTTANNDNHRSVIGFSTPNTNKTLHLIMEVSASSAAEMFLLEAPTVDNDAGTEDTSVNRSRGSSNISTILSLEGTPVAGDITTYTETQIAAANFSGGLELDHVQLVIGSGPKAVGGSTRGEQEWLLKQNTKYIIYIRNVGASINLHEIHLDWYERISILT